MRLVERHRRLLTPHHPWCREIDAQCQRPNGESSWIRNEDRCDPDRGRRSEANQVTGHQTAGLGDMPIHPPIEGEQDQAGDGVPGREDGRRGRGAIGERGGHDQDGDHLGCCQRAIDEVVGVVAVGIEGVAGPEPPEQSEIAEEGPQSCPGGVGKESLSEDGDGHDEGEVVEELEPGGTPTPAFSQCLKTRGSDPGHPPRPWLIHWMSALSYAAFVSSSRILAVASRKEGSSLRSMTVSPQPYLPRIVRDWDEDAPGNLHQCLEGSMVFVDISGFTAMSERLARHGKLGAEELTAVISATFGELLGAAYSYGANLLKFGGDALLLFFSGEGHERRACAAAQAMQQRLAVVGVCATSAGTITLRMSVGIHSGMFDFFLVGGSHRELIVAGPAATRIVEMESMARAGQVLLSPATAEAMPGANRGRAQDTGVLLRGKVDAEPSNRVPPNRP